MPMNGWSRFPGGKAAELPLGRRGETNDVVKPGGVRESDGLVTMYVGQTGNWKCIAVDPLEAVIVAVGSGSSLQKARLAALGS